MDISAASPLKILPVLLVSVLALSGCSSGGDDAPAGASPPAESQSPTQARLVSVISADAGSITVDWLPAEDRQTPHADMVYTIHLSEQEDFTPDATTAVATVTGAVTATVAGLEPGTRYYVAVVARDQHGNESWSNQLVVTTVATVAQRSQATVHAQEERAVRSVTDTTVTFETGTQEPPGVGDIIVGAGEGGYLRKVARITEESGQATAETEPAALNEVFEEFELSTTVRLGDYADDPATTQGKQMLRTIRRADGTTELHWPSGLTIIDTNPSPKAAPPSVVPRSLPRGGEVVIDEEGGRQRVLWGEDPVRAEVNGPIYEYVEPGQALSFTLQAHVFPHVAESEICDIRFKGLDYPGSSPTIPPDQLRGHFVRIYPEDAKLNADYVFTWTPDETHVNEDATIPYEAKFRVYIDKKGDDCNGDDKLGLWQATLDITVPIYVGVGSPHIDRHVKVLEFSNEEDNVIAGARLEMENRFTVAFEPEFNIHARISRARLQSARMAVESEFIVRNELLIEADGAAVLLPTERELLSPRKFIRVYYPGGVPVVVGGEFAIRVRMEGKVTGAMELRKTLEIALTGSEFGIRYERADGQWQRIADTGELGYEFNLQGEGGAEADVKITLIPDFRLTFYGTASGRILLEPYLYGDAAIRGQFRYLHTDGVGAGDADYWFERLVAGAGMDLRLYAGLTVLDRNLLSYPEDVSIDQVKDFAFFTPIDKTPIWGLPRLTVTTVLDDDEPDSRTILLNGHAEDVPFPFGRGSLNPFEKWTTPKLLEDGLPVPPERAYLQPREGQPGAYRLVYLQPGTYTVRLFGHGEAGWFLRQMVEEVFDLADVDGDGMIDQWEWRHDVDDPAADPDGDGLTNLEEFRAGTYPRRADAPFTAHTDESAIRFAWKPVPGAAGYRLYIATEPGITPANHAALANGRMIEIPADQTAYTLQGADQATTYHAIVAVIDGNGTVTPLYTEITVTTPTLQTYYQDADGDGYGNPAITQSAATPPAGYVADGRDCNDGDFTINPGANEIVGDGIDNDCDGQVDEAPPAIATPLNDTGITWGGNYPSGNNATCIGETIAQQDCSHGRDATHDDDGDGHAGFSFTKLDAAGNPLPASATEWSCVRDNVTGLIWEVKHGGNGIIGDEGLHDADDRYTWYNTDPATNGGFAGYADDDGAVCHGYDAANPATYCNTQAFVARVNAAGLCGASDWRLPTVSELEGLVHFGRTNPAIDVDYFPNTRSSLYWYWASSPAAFDSNHAWYVHFDYGYSNYVYRDYAPHVRLVRGGQ